VESNTLTLIKRPSGGSTPSLRRIDPDALASLRDLKNDYFLLVEPPRHPGPTDIHTWERWPGAMLVTLDSHPIDAPPNFARLIAATGNPGRIRVLAEWVAELAAPLDSHVYLLVTLEQHDEADDADLMAEYQLAQEQLAEIASSLRLLGIHTNWEVRFGELGEEVATLARTTGTEVVALDRPGADGPQCDVNRVYRYLERNGPRLHLLVKPADESRSNGKPR